MAAKKKATKRTAPLDGGAADAMRRAAETVTEIDPVTGDPNIDDDEGLL